MDRKHDIWIVLPLVLAISVSLYLVVKEVTLGNFCPRIINVPACYIVLVLYALALLSEMKGKFSTYIISLSGAMILAIWFSINKLMGNSDCPAPLGIPLCYASFFLCDFLTAKKVLNLVVMRKNKYNLPEDYL